jgi:hypothetical protein
MFRPALSAAAIRESASPATAPQGFRIALAAGALRSSPTTDTRIRCNIRVIRERAPLLPPAAVHRSPWRGLHPRRLCPGPPCPEDHRTDRAGSRFCWGLVAMELRACRKRDSVRTLSRRRCDGLASRVKRIRPWQRCAVWDRETASSLIRARRQKRRRTGRLFSVGRRGAIAQPRYDASDSGGKSDLAGGKGLSP